MNVKITYYLDVTSSWCYWAEPTWAELRGRYVERVAFQWKIAQLAPDALPVSRTQCEWFYRRSGTIMRAPTMLHAGWLEPDACLVPNLLAEAAKDFDVVDDRIRLALARAAMEDGRQVGRWEEAMAVVTPIVGKDAPALLERAKSADIAARIKASTEEFFAFKVTQRPAFVIEDKIGDRAILSGIVATAPLAATIEAMLNDTAAYDSYAAHHGGPPPG